MPNDIEKAYKRLALKLHPDKGGDTQTFQALGEAKDILLNLAKNNPQTPGMISGKQVPLQITDNSTERIGRGLSNFSSNPAEGLPNVEKSANISRPKRSKNSDVSSLPNMRSNEGLKPQAKSESTNEKNLPSRQLDTKGLTRNFESSKPSRREIVDKKAQDTNLPETRNDSYVPEPGELVFPEAKNEEDLTDYVPDARELTPEEIRQLAEKEGLRTKDIDNLFSRNSRVETLEELKERNAAQRQLEALEKTKIQVETIQKELEELPEDETTKRETLEAQEYVANKKLQQEMIKFQEQMKELKAREEQDLLDEASRRTALIELEHQETLAAEKEKPLSNKEISKIAFKYHDNFNERIADWRREHPYGTHNDFIDFELGFKDKQPTTAEFTQALKELLMHDFADFKNYNQATQDEIMLKLELTFFRMSDEPRSSESDWKNKQKEAIQNKMLKQRKSDLIAKIEKYFEPKSLSESNQELDNLINFVRNTIITNKSTLESLPQTDQELNDQIKDTLQKIKSQKENQLQQIEQQAAIFKNKQNQNPELKELYLEKRRAMKEAYDALKNSDIPLTKNKLAEQLESPRIEKENQIKKLKAILAVYNPVTHFIDANYMTDPQNLATKITRSRLQEVLETLNKPNAEPLTNDDFEEFETMYQKIHPSKK